MNLAMPKLAFPCQPQSIVDFVSEVIKRRAIVQLVYQDGYTIRYSYKDFLWDTTNQQFPLYIAGEGRFDRFGYEQHCPKNWLGYHKLVLIEMVEGWI